MVNVDGQSGRSGEKCVRVCVWGGGGCTFFKGLRAGWGQISLQQIMALLNEKACMSICSCSH